MSEPRPPAPLPGPLSGPTPGPLPPGWRIETADYADPDALLLVEQVQQEYVVRYGGRDETPLDPAMFVAPAGSFFVGYLDGEPVATGAWRARTDLELLGTSRTAEVKRMYVVQPARGLGLARAMLARLEVTAATAGAEAMVLETGSMQPEAIALYESSGYVQVASFGHYRDSPLNRCFAKRLT